MVRKKGFQRARSIHDMHLDDDEMLDEIDSFNKNKNFVDLDPNKDEVSSSDDNQIRGVLDLEHEKLSDFESDEYDHEYYDEGDQEYYDEGDQEYHEISNEEHARRKIEQEKQFQIEEAMTKNWGGRAGTYYGDDNEDFGHVDEDEEITLAEAQECIKLQKEWLDEIKEEDLNEHMNILVAVDEEERRKKKKKKKLLK